MTRTTLAAADGNTTYAAPCDRPFDWTASGKKKLLDRTFNYFTTNEGLKEVAKYADGLGPWKVYIQSTALRDINEDGTIGDENGDGLVDGADRKVLPPTTLVDRATPPGCSSTPGRSATIRAGSPTTTRATRCASTTATSRSASTACSPTSPTPRSRHATPSSATDDQRDGGRVASVP